MAPEFPLCSYLLDGYYCIFSCGAGLQVFSDSPSTVAHSGSAYMGFNTVCLVESLQTLTGQDDEELPKVASSGVRRPKTADENP